MTKKMNLAKVLTLSLLLAGMNTMYITPGAEAAVDATTTVTKENVDAGGYNSIKVNMVTEDNEHFANAIKGEDTSYTVKMSGDRLIEATSENTAGYATALGVGGAANEGTILSSDGKITINVKAIGGTEAGEYGNGSASATGLQAGGKCKIVINGDVAITAKAIGGNATYASGSATGLYNESGNITLGGNVEIKTEASNSVTGKIFQSISMGAFGVKNMVGTNNLSSTGKTKTLEGDVVVDTYGINNLVLDTDGSYLQGNILSTRVNNNDPYGENNITIANGAKWRPVYDNRYGSFNVYGEQQEGNIVYESTYKVAALTVDASGNITLNKDGIIDLDLGRVDKWQV
jgi:hypothetical protein